MVQALRPAMRIWQRSVRSAGLAFACLAGLAGAGFARDADITQAQTQAVFDLPTNRYGHAVLGNTPEWGRLCMARSGQRACITLPRSVVFEDIAPRLFDVDQDGMPEAIVVQSHANTGAALAVYDLLPSGELTSIKTPDIGTRFRWLAPIGAADFDGDGAIEIAYIDRPHLAKTLRVWRFRDGRLEQVANKKGLTNHRIGEDFITGGVRSCAGVPEIITANAAWTRVMATRLIAGRLRSYEVGPFEGLQSVRAALACSSD